MESYFFQLLRAEPDLSGIYYGDKEGNFVYVMKSDGPGPYRTKFISTETNQRQVDFIWRDNAYAVVARSSDPSDSYDAQAKLSVSPSGRKIIFTSDWWGRGEINDYVISID